MLPNTPTGVNGPLSIFPENPKLSFLISCVRRGCYIFPLHHLTFDASGTPQCSCGNGSDCMGPGKHPFGRWSSPLDPHARRTEVVIANYVEKWPDRGWGLHLGLSGLVCVDIDPRNGGNESLEQLVASDVMAGGAANVVTGSGGRHFYFAAPDNCDPRRGWRGPNGQYRTSVLLAPGVDFLAGQHFVVLPYSPHKNGGLYTWNPEPQILPPDPALVDRVNAQRAFEISSRTARHEYRLVDGSELPPGAPSCQAALAYLSTMEPAVSGKEGSRRTGRVASVLIVDFGLDRQTAKSMLREWNSACDPPWTDAELDRKLDWAESRPGTRGWRNNARRSDMTPAEEKLNKLFAEIPIGWGRRLLHVTTGEITDVKKTQSTVTTEEFSSKEDGSWNGDGMDVPPPIDDDWAEECPQCQRWRRILLKYKGESKARIQAVPCRRLDCPACFIVKKQWYIDTHRHHLWKWEREQGGESCQPLFYATISRDLWKKIASRLRAKNAQFFRIDPFAIGTLAGESFLVVATAFVSGPIWEDISPEQAAALLESTVNSLPQGLQRRVWWSSRAWKILREDQEGKKKMDKLGYVTTKPPTVKKICEWHGIDYWTVYGGGRRWPWSAIEFSFEPEIWDKLRADLEAGDTLGAGATFARKRASPTAEEIPEVPIAFRAAG